MADPRPFGNFHDLFLEVMFCDARRKLCSGTKPVENADDMKVIIKFHNHTEIVENVSVDEKCFPLVGGVHPYPEASQQDSQLANQSSLWFKTLAIDCIFVDCDKSEVHWFPMVNDVNPDLGVILRKARPDHYESSFIMSVAKPLFEDAALYEMDPSLKGMMLTCSEAMRKLAQKKMAKADFNRAIASILHVYILPSIQFSPEDMYCLSRTRCLIEDRLNNAENLIKSVVESIDRLEICLTTLRTNMLFREKLESEDYLQTCNQTFLKVFVKNLEDELVNLNLGLEAQQSKVNWAKQHESESKVAELKVTRDKLHTEIVKLIRVREAIRNVTVRKEFLASKVSKRRKKAVEVASCFHDVFVEVVRRLEAENKTLERLCQDKLNISAAREASMATIMELENNNRVSERTTKFEPEDFVDYSINVDSGSKKSDLWPTFQERVTAILENSSSKSRLVHRQGCEALSSRIDLALSEFHLAVLNGVSNKSESHKQAGAQEDAVQMRPASIARSRQHSKHMRSTVCTWDKGVLLHEATLRRASFTQGIPPQESSLYSQDQQVDSLSAREVSGASDSKDEPFGSSENDSGDFPEAKHNLKRNRYRQRINEKLALASLLKSVDEIKQALQAHFREMVSSLIQEFEQEKELGLDRADQKELLWKSYERIFMKGELDRLTSLYETLLTPGTQRTYATLQISPLQTILKEDKILQLFYGTPQSSSPVDCVSPQALDREQKFSMAKTLSEPSLDVRHCAIEELYTLANADSSDIQKRFQLETSGEDSDVPSSSGSSTSSSFQADDVSHGTSPKAQILDFSVSFASEKGKGSVTTGSVVSVLSSRQQPQSVGSHQQHLSANDIGQSPDEILMLPGEEEDRNTSDLPTENSQAQLFESSLSSFASSISLNDEDTSKPSKKQSRKISRTSSQGLQACLDLVLSPFRKSVRKCLEAHSLMDKMRYIGRAIQGLNRQVWQLMDEEEQASCDDILSMLVVALCHMPEDVFIGLYINVRMLMDIYPPFLDGTLWNCSLVNLYASYDFLFTHNVCEKAVRDFSGSLRIKF